MLVRELKSLIQHVPDEATVAVKCGDKHLGTPREAIAELVSVKSVGYRDPDGTVWLVLSETQDHAH